MSEAKPNAAEPSMEEILASIRRIISEDSDGASKPAAAAAAPRPVMRPAAAPAIEAPRPAAPAPVPAVPEPPARGAEVLELTQMVGSDGSVVSLKPVRAVPEPETPKPVLPPVQAAPAPMAPPRAEAPLTSKATAGAMAAAIASLQGAVREREARTATSTPVGPSGLTVEEIVRQELRGMLQAWLDQHLPAITERLVRREVERLVRDADRG